MNDSIDIDESPSQERVGALFSALPSQYNDLKLERPFLCDRTTAFHGEDASVIKKRLMEAGAGDPRAMWREKKREKSMHVAMVVRSV